MPDLSLTLSVLPDYLAVCRLAPEAAIPAWAMTSPFLSITRTADELSIVCAADQVPTENRDQIRCERDWQGFKIEGPLDFSLTGILVAIAAPLADAGISIFAIATYDTDYVLVRRSQADHAIAVLRQHGHTIQNTSHPA